MAQRTRLNINGTTAQVLYQMSEGNPGGLTVLMQLMEKGGMDAFMTLLNMDDMNIRGSMIWIGYKDVCGHDLDAFIEKVNSRDEAMVKAINDVNRGYDGHYAVTSGASYKHV